MVPKKMNMNQHSNAGKEKSSEKIANRFNLQKKSEQLSIFPHTYIIKNFN
jgi:hypothetical protein